MSRPAESRVIEGDCIEAMAAMPEASVDAIVTDPPYGLGFMGREWDDLPPGLPWARECLRMLKPGGHLLAFGGTRTYHRLTCAIEDAGFEIRDCLAWLYGSGFPKSRNVGEGRGTALKPAHEPIVLARKPLAGTVADNVLAHGTGALNVDATRIDHDAKSAAWVEKWSGHGGHPVSEGYGRGDVFGGSLAGRWPANVCLDEDAAALLDQQTGEIKSGWSDRDTGTGAAGVVLEGSADGAFNDRTSHHYADSGGASRFFYCAKASTRERGVGLATRNGHPTVKPIELMRWLVRLVTPPGGIVLDPFAGSGTTGCAAALEGFDFLGIEREAEYVQLARARIAHWSCQQMEMAA